MNPYIRPDDGPWMKRYLTWAAPYYDKFNPERRLEVVEIDRWLYSRNSIGFVIGLIGSALGLFLGLRAAGLSNIFSALATFVAYALVLIAVANTWFAGDILTDRRPKFIKQSPLLAAFYLLLLSYSGALVGFVFGAYSARKESFTVDRTVLLFIEGFEKTAPAAAALAFLMVGVVCITLVIKKQQLQFRLSRLSNEANAQKTLSALNEAKLRVLQAQIKPHFLFNTLAALQYWTDTGDTRASGLLKSLTAFLRGSTDSMDNELIDLAEEISLVSEYLKIMQYRMDKKLSVEINLNKNAEQAEIPPALLLTLVENAVEHGIEPSLNGGLIQIDAVVVDAMLNLTVRNTGSALRDQYRDGVGLTNSRERIKALYGEQGFFELTGGDAQFETVARLRCPAQISLNQTATIQLAPNQKASNQLASPQFRPTIEAKP
jgi:Histidine kinase